MKREKGYMNNNVFSLITCASSTDLPRCVCWLRETAFKDTKLYFTLMIRSWNIIEQPVNDYITCLHYGMVIWRTIIYIQAGHGYFWDRPADSIITSSKRWIGVSTITWRLRTMSFKSSLILQQISHCWMIDRHKNVSSSFARDRKTRDGAWITMYVDKEALLDEDGNASASSCKELMGHYYSGLRD